jgi:hypothetical protein
VRGRSCPKAKGLENSALGTGTFLGMTMRGRATREAPVRTEPHPTKRVREEPLSYRDLAMAAEIGWRPAPNGEPGMGVRTPLEAIR